MRSKSQQSTMMMRRGPIKLALLLICPIIYLLHRHQELRFPAFRKINIAIGDGLFSNVQQIPMENNLVAQNEGISRGPWVIDPPLPSQITTKPITIRFRCLWHASDLCPKRYIVLLRGPTIYSPPLSAIKQDGGDPTVVTVKIEVPQPGHYQLFAWPDFDACPHHWRDNMEYPINRGQVMGTPAVIDVTGQPTIVDALGPCTLFSSEATGRSHGRWIAKSALQSKYRKSEWVTSFPEKQEYIYQPYECKRRHTTAAVIKETRSVSQILFIGDSVLRGAFCSQVWPQLSPSSVADGSCKFINDATLYHVAPKDMQYITPDKRTIGLSFRFMDDRPADRLAGLKGNIPSPSHIVANLGLWLAPLKVDQYETAVTGFLERMYEMYPNATVIWRTTTDVAPMINCFSDKGMTRSTIYEQREVSFDIIKAMKSKGMRIYLVDGYAMTAPRPDAANDGRHWVIESPDEYNWLPKSRPSANDAEAAILDGVWDIILQDDQKQQKQSTALWR
ncbi:hypothetical protein K440DRAFT_127225 [Wilcoxina mikolae CBS 423.85]|nr:hypothetical protein K440DRAFT_127225 [Wilcoxina mikolae CBS 423.85]